MSFSSITKPLGVLKDQQVLFLYTVWARDSFLVAGYFSPLHQFKTVFLIPIGALLFMCL